MPRPKPGSCANRTPTWLLSAIDTHIVPRLARVEAAAETLTTDVKTLCAAPGDSGLLERAQKSFANTVEAWGAIDFIRFGPVAEEHRLERFFFWPDPRATTERQLQALLAKRDPKLLDEKALIDESVAVQGLGALEFILWNEKKPLDAGDDDARYRCQFATAISTNLATSRTRSLTAGRRPAAGAARCWRRGPTTRSTRMRRRARERS
ncbi:MAG: imelysin family protein [Hyphomicrobium sp.]